MSVQLTVENFGPIGGGTVQLKPLTILIGPNNAGKSYLAMLTYAATHDVRYRRRRFPLFRRRAAYKADPAFSEYKQDFLARWSEAKGSLTLPEQVLEDLNNDVREALEQYGRDFVSEIERGFSRQLVELVRVNKTNSKCSIEVRHGNPRWALNISAGESSPLVELTVAPNVKAIAKRIMSTLPDQSRLFSSLAPPELLWEQLVELILNDCFREFPTPAYYLPAARSGILQSHKLLASIIVSRSSFAGIEDMQVGRLTGVLSDFISHLLRMDARRKTQLAEIADYLESAVLKGKVLITGSRPAYPEIVYEAGEGRYQLPSTSSMVSELAPVVLFLRYLVDPGEMVVIEEPESHLHPAVQQKLARAIARLVNAKVTVVLTTHSDYFLTQINNLILAGGLEPKKRTAAGYTSEECLEVSKVAAYLFKPTAKGTTIKRMRIARARGISQAEFARAAEVLYTETVALERSLPDAD